MNNKAGVLFIAVEMSDETARLRLIFTPNLLHSTHLKNTHPLLPSVDCSPNSGHHNLRGSRAASERPATAEQSTCAIARSCAT